YLLACPDGLPAAWCLATPRLGEREVVAALLDHERARLRPGLLILGDKGFAGQEFEQLVGRYGARLLRPDRADEPRRVGSPGRWCGSGTPRVRRRAGPHDLGAGSRVGGLGASSR